jgi:hypothetical protein
MGFWTAVPIVGKIIEGVIGLIDKAVLDKDEANRIKAEVTKLAFTQEHEKWVQMIEEQGKIIVAEAQGSWLQRSWRPILMLVIITIVANNYLIAPYLSPWFPEHIRVLELPLQLWDLMEIGVGGYIVGRSVEKGVETWKAKS